MRIVALLLGLLCFCNTYAGETLPPNIIAFEKGAGTGPELIGPGKAVEDVKKGFEVDQLGFSVTAPAATEIGVDRFTAVKRGAKVSEMTVELSSHTPSGPFFQACNQNAVYEKAIILQPCDAKTYVRIELVNASIKSVNVASRNGAESGNAVKLVLSFTALKITYNYINKGVSDDILEYKNPSVRP